MAHGGEAVDAPISLAGLFGAEADDASEADANHFDQLYEVQTLNVAGVPLRLRQFTFHSKNANKVWPGTFGLADFLLREEPRFSSAESWLELGAATGALAAWIVARGWLGKGHTSDFDDGGEIADNIAVNFGLNGLRPLAHIPYCWGDDFPGALNQQFDLILASDILLYVQSYPALVDTLSRLFDRGASRFLMFWGRRRVVDASSFLDLMRRAGFALDQPDRFVYLYTRPAPSPAVGSGGFPAAQGPAMGSADGRQTAG
eukprot:GGOE01036808.1.p1 GENE.GGOE01036808.1~~GGOE01036808.1.p1  ORF type:complete len:259 (-),score=65.66 GGOE01036808.1:71-847(-)